MMEPRAVSEASQATIREAQIKWRSFGQPVSSQAMHLTRLHRVLEVHLTMLPQGVSRAVPVPAARRSPSEGPTRGSSAALEALLNSPRAADSSSLSPDSPAVPAPPPDSPMRATLLPHGGDPAAAPGKASTAAAQLPSPRQWEAMTSLSPRSRNSATGEGAGQGFEGRGVVATGGVSEGIVGVPDTPPSPFMKAQQELAGLAPVLLFEAPRSAPRVSLPCSDGHSCRSWCSRPFPGVVGGPVRC